MKHFSLFLALVFSPVLFAEESSETTKLRGAVEVEASSRESYHGTYSNDIINFTAMIGASAQLHRHMNADLNLIYEENSTALEVDEAFLTYGPRETVFVKAGKSYLPLADMSSKFVSDSFTKTLTEIRESAASIGGSFSGLSFEAFTYSGDVTRPDDGKRFRDFGATFQYLVEIGTTKISPRIGYLNNSGDISAVETALSDVNGDNKKNDLAKNPRAMTSSVGVEINSFNFFIEWAKIQSFKRQDLGFRDYGASPTATTLEGSYQIPVSSFSITPILGHQISKESVKIALPKSRILAGLKFDLNDQAGIVYEFNRSKDYGTNECDVGGGTCGTSKKSSAHIVKLSASF